MSRAAQGPCLAFCALFASRSHDKGLHKQAALRAHCAFCTDTKYIPLMSSKQRPASSAEGTVIHAWCTALHWQRIHAETRGYRRTGPGARVCGKVAGVAAPGDAAIAWHQAHTIRHLHATHQALQLGYRVPGVWCLAPGAHPQAPANPAQAIRQGNRVAGTAPGTRRTSPGTCMPHNRRFI